MHRSLKKWFLGLVFVVPVFAADNPPPSLIAQADAAYAKRADLPEAKIALITYQRSIASDPVHAEPYWKASRAAWWVADHSNNREEKMNTFLLGVTLAQQGIERDPNSAEAFMWLSACNGSYGEAKGIFKSLALVKPIRQELAEVNRINDRYDGGGAYRILGVLDYKVPGIVGGNKKRALEELQKSLAIDPQNPFTHYYLAEYYQTVGDKAKARLELETLAHLSAEPDEAPELAMMQLKGEKLKEDLK